MRPTEFRYALLIMAMVTCFIAPANAWAYLDAGSGSYIIQILIASIVGVAFAFKAFWIKMIHSIVRLFKKKKNEQPR
jgi:hypothetical protein